MDDNDVSLPKATLQKMIKELMPNLRCNPDTVDLLIECCTEFVHLLSSESNDISNRERKNTIHPEHVLQALKDLGFGEFVPEVKQSWENWKADHKNTASLKKQQKDQGRTEGELIALQRKLLDEAKARSNSFQAIQDLDNRKSSGDPGWSNPVAVLSAPLSTFESMMPPCSTKLEELQSPFGQSTTGHAIKAHHLLGKLPPPMTRSLDVPQPIVLPQETMDDRLPNADEQGTATGNVKIFERDLKGDGHELSIDVEPVRSDAAMSIDTAPSDRT